jgi:hypothetical protein
MRVHVIWYVTYVHVIYTYVAAERHVERPTTASIVMLAMAE